MKYDKSFELNSYSSLEIEIKTIEEGIEFLEKLLMSDLKLQPRIIDKIVVLYGAGSLGKMAKKFFEYMDIPFLYFVDKNALQLKSESDWRGVNIIKPEEVKEADKKNCLLIICIVKTQLIPLRDELGADGWEDIAFFYDVCEAYSDNYPLSNGWFLNKPNKNEFNDIKKVFSQFDEESRLYYLQFLAWRRLRIELLLKGLQIQSNRYFIPEIINILHENEVFIDAGAHIGLVTLKFIELINKNYKKIYAIEVDDDNFKILKKNLRDFPKCKIIRCALSDKKGKKNFYQGFDYASKLNDSGENIVNVTALDDLNIPATFIKMHLEGGELSALRGALNTIKEYRPILSITIYHTPNDFLKTPLFLMNCVKDYKFHLRLDSWGGTGAVFYAIPKERSVKTDE